MNAVIIRKQNTQFLQVLGVKDRAGAVISDATVTVSLNDASGTVVGGINALALAPMGGTPGGYEAAIDSTVDPPIGLYTLNVNVQKSGSVANIGVQTVVEVRTY